MPVFFEPAGGVAQLTYALIVCFVTFGMYMALSPYVDDGEDRLAQLCQAQIFVTLVCTIALRSDREATGATDSMLSALAFIPIALALAGHLHAEIREIGEIHGEIWRPPRLVDRRRLAHRTRRRLGRILHRHRVPEPRCHGRGARQRVCNARLVTRLQSERRGGRIEGGEERGTARDTCEGSGVGIQGEAQAQAQA